MRAGNKNCILYLGNYAMHVSCIHYPFHLIQVSIQHLNWGNGFEESVHINITLKRDHYRVFMQKLFFFFFCSFNTYNIVIDITER